MTNFDHFHASVNHLDQNQRIYIMTRRTDPHISPLDTSIEGGMGDVRIGVAPTARSAATAHVLVREKNKKNLQKNEN